MIPSEHVGSVFTIVTGTHLNFANCFFDSLVNVGSVAELPFRRYLFILGADDVLSIVPSDGVIPLRVEEILDPSVIKQLADLYTPAEFCWALKPYLFRWLLEQFDTVFYFDSDIWFLGSFKEVITDFTGANILLTPHYLEPFDCSTRFGVRALSLLRGGVFNAGFVAVRRGDEAHRFLDWWIGHVSRHCRNDPNNGMCGDQRWLDLVPVLFDSCKISRHPGMNVGYWNIHERPIKKGKQGYEVLSRPLVFIHLSSFDAQCPRNMSSHLPSFSADGELAEILEAYAVALKSSRLSVAKTYIPYVHTRWWHRHVRLYRWFIDLFHSPRSCI